MARNQHRRGSSRADVGDSGGGYDLWLVDLERGIRSRFTFNPASDWSPTWSRDGQRIAFTSIRGGTQDLWIKEVDGNTGAELLLESENNIEPVDWSPGDEFLLFNSISAEGNTDLYLISTSGDEEPRPVLATPFSERHGQISPDGRWMLYNSNESGKWEIYVTSFPEPGRKWQVSENGGYFPRWGPTGNEIFFVLADEMLMVARVDSSGPTIQIGEITPLFPTFRSVDPSIDYAIKAAMLLHRYRSRKWLDIKIDMT